MPTRSSTNDQLSFFETTEPSSPVSKKSPKITRDINFSVSLSSLLMNPDQPRNYVDEEQLAGLCESIKLHGIIQPVVVKKGSDRRYILVAGQRRYLAARMAGLDRLPAILTDGDPFEIALIENLQRSNLTAIEEATALSHLKELKGYTLEQMSEILGKAKPTICEIISLIRLPGEIQDRCREDSSIPRSILVNIARMSSHADMIMAFDAHLKGLGRKEIRKLQEKPIRPAKRTESKFLTSFVRRIENFDVEKLGEKQRERVKNELEKLHATIENLLTKFQS
jgi:ParB family transcriptional regulator, chromosome partitioning protein